MFIKNNLLYRYTLCFIIGFLCTACTPETKDNRVTEKEKKTIEVTDQEGTVVKLKKPAQKVITLAPHLAEMVFSIDGGKQLVAVTNYTEFPESTKPLPSVGPYNGVSIESILSYSPDLVVAWGHGTKPAQITRLRKMGIPIYVSKALTLDDVAKETLDLGELMGKAEVAQHTVQAFNDKLNNIEQKYNKKSRLSVYLYYRHGTSSMYTFSNNGIWGNLLNYCNADNVFADEPYHAFTVGLEQIVKKNPQVIISLDEHFDSSMWKKWKSIEAVKENHIYNVGNTQIKRPGIKVLPALEELCQRIDDARGKASEQNKH